MPLRCASGRPPSESAERRAACTEREGGRERWMKRRGREGGREGGRDCLTAQSVSDNLCTHKRTLSPHANSPLQSNARANKRESARARTRTRTRTRMHTHVRTQAHANARAHARTCRNPPGAQTRTRARTQCVGRRYNSGYIYYKYNSGYTSKVVRRAEVRRSFSTTTVLEESGHTTV